MFCMRGATCGKALPNIFKSATIPYPSLRMERELKMFGKAFPHVAPLMQNMQSVLDLQPVHQDLKTNFPQIFERASDAHVTSAASDVVKTEERGLSELVRLCFGRPLSKGEQLSDWERRPLRSTQLQYAALDAVCLRDIHAHLQARISQLNLDLDLHARFLGHGQPHAFATKSKAERRQARVR